MNNKHRILLMFAFFAVIVSSVAFRPTASYADGNIHVVIVCSTTDKGLSDKVTAWKEQLLNALTNDNFNSLWLTIPEAMAPAGKSGLGSDGVTIYPVLEGEEATPEKIMKTCLEVSHNAGPDDAIVFFIACHGSSQKGKDDVFRHYFSPVATSKDDLNQNGRIQRETIINCLTHEIVDGKKREKNHRLIMLISDSCATPSPDLEIELTPPHDDDAKTPDDRLNDVKVVEELVPKEKSYFREFLDKAPHGTVININSCNEGEEASYFKSNQGVYDGSLFIHAFCVFATNGFYLDDEVKKTDNFYKLLSIELERQRLYVRDNFHEMCDQRLTQFDGNAAIEPEEINLDFTKYYKDRTQTLKKSGEFTIKQVTIGTPTPSGSETPDSFDPSATGTGF